MKARQIFQIVCLLCVFSTLSRAGTYSGGSGDPNDPYLIADENDWVELTGTSADWSACFELTADIDLSNVTNLIPVGAYQNTFTGIFYGNDFTISNATINAPSYGGLFGYLGEGGEIWDLGVENSNVSGYYVGGLVGRASGCTISNCYATGTIGRGYSTGGLVGYSSGSTISNCYSTDASIDVDGYNFGGGLVGYSSGSTISNCYATGTIDGGAYAGGLVGYPSNNTTISDCYATSTVDNDGYAGGLAGYVAIGTIRNCYATGNVDGENYAGGLVGFAYGITISSCYATGTVDGVTSVGGLAGGISGTINNSFWDMDTSGMTVGVGSGSNSGLMGLATAQMQTESNFLNAGWDFVREDDNGTDDTWIMNGYPHLAWEYDEVGYFFMWYVDASVTSSGDGRSWDTAFKYLQEALDAAADLSLAGDAIWVAEGTYYPDEGSGYMDNDPNQSFMLVPGVSVYGGFDPAGGDDTWQERNWTANETILSGDIDQDTVLDNDNSYHVVMGANDVTLDGFTITFGNANGTGNNQYGGGILNIQVSPTLSNCNIQGNYADYGGGIFNNGTSSNWASTDVFNCLLIDNEAMYGTAVFNNGYVWDFIKNCTFSKNEASALGGAIYNLSSYQTDIVNSILWGDTDSTAANLEVISDNSWVEISYSNIGNTGTVNGGTINKGTGNLAINPLFADPGNNDFHLKSAVGRWNGSSWLTTDTTTSWCVDAGQPTSSYANEPSPNGGVINMGAYGNTTEASKSDSRMIIYVDCDNTTSPWLGTASDPYRTIDDGIDQVRSQGIVYVLDGTYHERLSFNSSHKGFSLIGINTPVIDGDDGGTVITFDNTSDTITIDGFGVIGGFNFRGGGVYIDNSSPVITNCILAANKAGKIDPDGYVVGGHGGGLCIDGGSPTISHCIFYSNFVDGVDHDVEDWPGYPNPLINYFRLNRGGAIYTDGSSATFSYCTIGNTAQGYMNWAFGNDYYPWASHEVYTNGSVVPIYDNCGVHGGFNGDRMDHNSTPPRDGGGNFALQ